MLHTLRKCRSFPNIRVSSYRSRFRCNGLRGDDFGLSPSASYTSIGFLLCCRSIGSRNICCWNIVKDNVIRVFFKAIRKKPGIKHGVSAGLNIAFLFVDYAFGVDFYESLVNYHRSIVINCELVESALAFWSASNLHSVKLLAAVVIMR